MAGGGPAAPTMADLLEAEAAGERLKLVCFWSHEPSGRAALGPHVLSQWYHAPFSVDGVTYPTAEHFMMAEKARLFDDDDALAAVLVASSPGEAKALGRGVRGFDSARWEAQRSDIVRRGSLAKFASSAELTGYLLGTGSRILVEASPLDRIWGIGLAADHPDVARPSCWLGLNLLGFALMDARAALAGGS